MSASRAAGRIPLLPALAAVALAQGIAAAIVGPGTAPAAGFAVALAAAVVIAGVALEPGRAAAAGAALPAALRWSALLAVGAGLLVAGNLGSATSAGLALRLAAGVGAVSLALVGVSRLLEELLGSPGVARLGVLLMLGLFGAGPLWLAPAVERLGGAGAFADAVVAASPLSCLSVLADYDYLRGHWFYTHSAMGSLRFAYPAGWQLGACYLGMGLSLLAGSSFLAGRRRR